MPEHDALIAEWERLRDIALDATEAHLRWRLDISESEVQSEEVEARVDALDAFVRGLVEELERLRGTNALLKAGAPVIKCCEHCELCALEREFTEDDNGH